LILGHQGPRGMQGYQNKTIDISICPGIKAALQARDKVFSPGGASWFLEE